MGKAWLTLLRNPQLGLALFIVLLAGATAAINPQFLAFSSLIQILENGAPIAIIACGVMLVIITGEIDISVGSLIGVLGAMTAVLVSEGRAGWNPWLVSGLVLLTGTAIGTMTGMLVTLGRVPSIIVTLGLLTALRGVAIEITGGDAIKQFPEAFRTLGTGRLAGLPLSIWIAAIVILITYVLITHTRTGRRLYAVGSNLHSAQVLGLSDRSLKCFTFALTGLFTAIATLLIVSKLGNVESALGRGDELLVVTCVVVGGVSISGGRGRLSGVVLAVVLMVMIRTILTYMNLGPEATKWERAIQGAFILGAVVIDHVVTRASRRGVAT